MFSGYTKTYTRPELKNQRFTKDNNMLPNSTMPGEYRFRHQLREANEQAKLLSEAHNCPVFVSRTLVMDTLNSFDPYEVGLKPAGEVVATYGWEHARECRYLSDHKGEYTEDDCTCGLVDDFLDDDWRAE